MGLSFHPSSNSTICHPLLQWYPWDEYENFVMSFNMEFISFLFLYVAGAVKNDELGISWRNSLYYIFRRITPRSNFPPSFKIILYFYAMICDAFVNTHFGRNGHFRTHYLYYRDTLQIHTCFQFHSWPQSALDPWLVSPVSWPTTGQYWIAPTPQFQL